MTPSIVTIRQKVENGYPLTNAEGVYLLSVLQHAERDRNYWLNATDVESHRFARLQRKLATVLRLLETLAVEAGDVKGSASRLFRAVAEDIRALTKEG